MDKKAELSNEALEKVSGGFTTSTMVDEEGNTIITKFGVMNVCSQCGACVNVCPTRAITIGPNGAEINGNECAICWVCADVCPLEAIGEKQIIIPAGS